MKIISLCTHTTQYRAHRIPALAIFISAQCFQLKLIKFGNVINSTLLRFLRHANFICTYVCKLVLVGVLRICKYYTALVATNETQFIEFKMMCLCARVFVCHFCIYLFWTIKMFTWNEPIVNTKTVKQKRIRTESRKTREREREKKRYRHKKKCEHLRDAHLFEWPKSLNVRIFALQNQQKNVESFGKNRVSEKLYDVVICVYCIRMRTYI